MLALIDADLISYPVAASCEDCTEDIAIARADKLIQDILDVTNATSYNAYLTGSNNFRKVIYPEYKANRKDKPLPKHLNLLREHLVTEWKVQVTDGYEADDALGIDLTHYPDAFVCSYDKDLDMLPGRHYNWYKNIIYDVSETEGLQSFYRSLLIGDRADNIIGVRGLGKVKAGKLIDPLTTEEEMLKLTRELYQDDVRYKMNAQCLWILRKEGEVWNLI